jgi:hypothetical protein
MPGWFGEIERLCAVADCLRPERARVDSSEGLIIQVEGSPS